MSVDIENYEELLLEREWRRCAPAWERGPQALAEAFEYFCAHYWWIKQAEGSRVLFKLYNSQRETVETWLNERFTLILKARQIGFSTLVATYTFWLTFFYPDRAVVMISKTEREAAKLLRHAKYGYRFLPEWMRMRGPIRIENTQTKLMWSNESGIESLPSASDPARGETVFLAVVDEIGYLPNGEQAYASIEPVADLGGRIIMLGSANGEGNLFHELWVNAQLGTNRYKPLFFPWSANGRDQEWYERQKAELQPWQLAQEYPDNPEEAFLRSGNPVFDLDMLRAIETVPPRARGYLWKPDRIEFVADGGDLAVWEFPQSKRTYVIGADVSEGLDHGDFTAAFVIEARERRVVAVYHGKIDADLFGSEVLNLLGRWYNHALLGVESNNHGLTTLKALVNEARYPNLYRQHRHAARFEPTTELLGWRTTKGSKPLAIDELAKELRDGLRVPDAPTIQELKTFVRDKGKMHGLPFDDRTMALAIAVQMLKYAWLPEYRPNEKPGPGTMGYFVEQMYAKDDRSSERLPIGAFNVRGDAGDALRVRLNARGRIIRAG